MCCQTYQSAWNARDQRLHSRQYFTSSCVDVLVFPVVFFLLFFFFLIHYVFWKIPRFFDIRFPPSKEICSFNWRHMELSCGTTQSQVYVAGSERTTATHRIEGTSTRFHQLAAARDHYLHNFVPSSIWRIFFAIGEPETEQRSESTQLFLLLLFFLIFSLLLLSPSVLNSNEFWRAMCVHHFGVAESSKRVFYELLRKHNPSMWIRGSHSTDFLDFEKSRGSWQE